MRSFEVLADESEMEADDVSPRLPEACAASRSFIPSGSTGVKVSSACAARIDSRSKES